MPKPFELKFHPENKNREDLVVFLRGLGPNDEIHPDFIKYFQDKNCDFSWIEKDDIELLKQSDTIDLYSLEISEAIAQVLAQEKNIHMVGTSWGGFWTLKMAEKFSEQLKSVLALNPLVDPYEVLKKHSKNEGNYLNVQLLNGRTLQVLRSNFEDLKDKNPKNIGDIPGLAILGEEDELEKVERLKLVKGTHLNKLIIPKLRHAQWAKNPDILDAINQFYVQVFSTTS